MSILRRKGQPTKVEPNASQAAAAEIRNRVLSLPTTNAGTNSAQIGTGLPLQQNKAQNASNIKATTQFNAVSAQDSAVPGNPTEDPRPHQQLHQQLPPPHPPQEKEETENGKKNDSEKNELQTESTEIDSLLDTDSKSFSTDSRYLKLDSLDMKRTLPPPDLHNSSSSSSSSSSSLDNSIISPLSKKPRLSS